MTKSYVSMKVGLFYCHVTLPGAFHAHDDDQPLDCRGTPLTHPNDGGQLRDICRLFGLYYTDLYCDLLRY